MTSIDFMLNWAFAQASTTTATSPAAEATTVAADGTMSQSLIWLYAVAALLLIFVLPVFIGSFLAKLFRLPNHGRRFAVTAGVLIASILVISVGKMRYGIDVLGGTVLLYEIDNSQTNLAANSDDLSVQSAVSAADVAAALQQRLNPGGTKDYTIRPYGQRQLEIVIPQADQFEIDEIKRLVSNSGVLQFRIVANSRDHSDIWQAADAQAKSEDRSKKLSREVRNADGRVVGVWYTLDREPANRDGIQKFREFNPTDKIRNGRTGDILTLPMGLEGDLAVERYFASQGIEEVDALIALERSGSAYTLVNGEDLSAASSGFDQQGAPTINFGMNAAGAQKMLALTAANQPTQGFKRRMAIILDGRVLSAPNLNSPISNRGQIEGRFTRDDVEYMVKILRSGRLPAVLNKEPLSQNQISSTLGTDTISKGFWAAVYSMIATFVMVLAYYRFPGFIACICLAFNAVLIWAVMIAIRQPLSLPGLAGLVLTVGMAVDANVLVFERIREEIEKGATKRLAIRNGFDRAMTTIVDSNLTTLISAFVLYAVGTDQVRGFAVSLIIGILCSMFTAVYVAHLLFDVAEVTKVIRLGMGDLIGWMRRNFLGNKDIDFMGMRWTCYTISGLVIAIGLIATFIRGKDILDVDLSGGTSVVFQLEKPDEVDNIRNLTKQMFDRDSNDQPISSTLTAIRAQGTEFGQLYRLDTSIFKQEELKKSLVAGFDKANGPKLVTYRVETIGGTPAAGSQGSVSSALKTRLVSFQPPAETPPAADATAPPAAPAVDTAVPPATPAAVPGAATDLAAAPAAPAPVSTKVTLKFKPSAGSQTAKIEVNNLTQKVVDSAKEAGISLVPAQIDAFPVNAPAGWTKESAAGFDEWTVNLPLSNEEVAKVVDSLQTVLQQEPVFLSLSEVGPTVAGEMQGKAIAAVLISLLFIGAYIWFRFQKVAFGVAAVVALFHDVLITLGCVAVSHWLFRFLGFALVEDFKINLAMIASFLTIIGYSLNDTIVVFDRIREVRGKSPRLTSSMINLSVNQTLSRTLLTSATTMVTVLLLYIFGGEGIHGFSFSLLIGIVVGTYSSVFVAAPVLLLMVGKDQELPSSK